MARGSHKSTTNWDYEDHPERHRVARRCKRLERLIQKRPKRFDRYSYSTRAGHRFMFHGMTPPSHSEFAGTYRGTAGTALEEYRIFFGGMEGFEPRFVAIAMGSFEQQCHDLTTVFASETSQPQAVRLLRLAEMLCILMEQFFRIHPFANGNGHAGRLMVMVLMVRQGFNPLQWRIDKSLQYHQAIHDYRRGKKKDLIKLMIKAIVGPLIPGQSLTGS